jgi:hypothetical protein
MQPEIDDMGLPVEVRIFGVNGEGLELGNASICEGRDIPWLQDTSKENVWQQWDVTYRDVVILDPENVPVAVYNLSFHDLSIPANYDSLETLLRQVAEDSAP